MTVLMAHMRYFKMNREKGIAVSYSQIPEAEIEEDSEYIVYNNWDRIKNWLKKIFKK